MKKSKPKKEIKKFDLDKMEFAKFKNLHLIMGGTGGEPVDPKNKSTGNCAEND
ncbi:hypothetical protein [Flavobacterium sp. Root186]|jgi:hypothetical protein|uniref:hypothetical protein n=1 Tax=Flavobacterium sp. Root186 TaxID=1736485 RepID=UPI000B18AD46|nr:hypothetical protein [Flavobacterium sp. Root186]